MDDLISKVQKQLDNNHAVEAEDIQALVNEAKQKREYYEGYAHLKADNGRLKELLEELGSAMSDEIVDKENGNYVKLKVDDIPEEMINFMP